MLKKFASAAFVIGALLTASTAALARDHGHSSGGNHGGPAGNSRSARTPQRNPGQNFSSGSRNYAPRGFSSGNRSFGGQSFVSPRAYRGYSAGPRYNSRVYIAPPRPVYRGYYGGGLYLGLGPSYNAYPYDPGYTYDPGYGYDPGYSYGPAPAPQQCTQGSYDQYGNWIPDPNCNYDQQQSPPPQQNYDPNQRQYPPAQQNYDPNQRQYPPARQNYNPNQQQYPQQQQQPGNNPNQAQRYYR